MRNYIISDTAHNDLDAIIDYLALDNLQAVENILTNLYQSFDTLSHMPRMGVKRPDLTSRPFRFWVVYPYLIVYTEEVERITIIRILSGYRDLTSLLT